MGLPRYGGFQLAIGATLRASISAAGIVQGRAAEEDACICAAARVDKEHKYVEIVNGTHCLLVALASDVGGGGEGFSSEAIDFLVQLIWSRSRAVPRLVCASGQLVWFRRWAVASV